MKKREDTKIKQRSKKMIAPIAVTVLMILYYAMYFGFLILLVPGIWKWLLGILPIALAALTVAVCVERMKEIQKGEEDDLSKY